VCVIDFPASNIRFVVFLKVVQEHYSGEANEFTISDVKFAQDSVAYTKNIEIGSFSPSYHTPHGSARVF